MDSPPEKVLNALADDLNTSEALAEINQIITQLNKSTGDDIKHNKASLIAAGRLFGILQESPDSWLGYEMDESNIDISKIENLLAERETARNERNFERADEIRDELKEAGVEIEDTPKGSIWRKIS